MILKNPFLVQALGNWPDHAVTSLRHVTAISGATDDLIKIKFRVNSHRYHKLDLAEISPLSMPSPSSKIRVKEEALEA